MFKLCGTRSNGLEVTDRLLKKLDSAASNADCSAVDYELDGHFAEARTSNEQAQILRAARLALSRKVAGETLDTDDRSMIRKALPLVKRSA